MTLSPQDLIEIIESSAFLDERLGPDFAPVPLTQQNRRIARARMDRWLDRVAQGDAVRFERRLKWDGLTSETAEMLAAGVRLRAVDSLPDWANCLRQVATQGGLHVGQTLEELEAANPFLEAGEPIAFAHLLTPFVRYGAEKVSTDAGTSLLPLADSAQRDLQRWLLRSLSFFAKDVLALEFSASRSLHDAYSGQSTPGAASDSGVPGRDFYRAFIETMWRGGLIRLFREYPVLARLLAQTTESWVSSVARFLSHLSQDMPDLLHHFGCGNALGRVWRIDAGLSDRHRGGKTAMRVHFENRASCIYKPRSLESESAYYRLLIWLNENRVPLSFKTFGGVYRESHGWVDVVSPLPCKDRTEVERYYRRAGVLLCLMYVLEGSDCNADNLIAHGEYPVLIDMETLLQSEAVSSDTTDTENASVLSTRAFFWNSVFRTYLLPRWTVDSAGNARDWSGLGSSLEQKHVSTLWEHPNTDGMRLCRRLITSAMTGNVVRLGDSPVDPSDYADQVLDGFSSMYQLLGDAADTLLHPQGPLASMANVPTRFVLRNTEIYFAIQQECLLPQNLRDGMDASIEADVLARAFLCSESQSPFWPVVAAERSAILQGDIPLFTTTPSSEVLDIGSGPSIAGLFARPGFENMKGRLAGLDSSDLERQIQYIRSALSPQAWPAEVTRRVQSADEPDVIDGEDDLIGEATRIAEKIRAAAISAHDGSVTWIARMYEPQAQVWQLQPMSFRLFDGVCGTALFLAALEQTTGGAGFRDLAIGALKMPSEAPSVPEHQHLIFEHDIGAGIGISSLVYALTRAGEWLGEPRLIESAERTAALITRERIFADRRYDLLCGAAGCLLALLALHKCRPHDGLLEKALQCGEHLLESRSASGAGPRSWKTLQGKLLGGFSHGAAGIAYALSLLAHKIGEKEFADAAREAIEYENGLYSEEHGNWLDLLAPQKRTGLHVRDSWCHGAPGIGLGRLASPASSDDTVFRLDIDRAVRATSSESLTELDHPCCGNLGRAELLLEAGRRRGCKAQEKQAKELADKVLRRAKRRGHFSLGPETGICMPSFHQGMAGIGYQLLRLARPDQLPSVLLWE